MNTERNRHRSERRSARLAEFQCAVGILGQKHSFDGYLLWTVLLDQLRDASMDDAQPVGERSAGGRDATLSDDGERATGAVDDPVTGAQAARVQAENARRRARQHARDGGHRLCRFAGPVRAPG
jgi:hypothetical protein